MNNIMNYDIMIFFTKYGFFVFQSSEELDTDTEFEPVEDMTIETRSRCEIYGFIV